MEAHLIESRFAEALADPALPVPAGLTSARGGSGAGCVSRSYRPTMCMSASSRLWPRHFRSPCAWSETRSSGRWRALTWRTHKPQARC